MHYLSIQFSENGEGGGEGGVIVCSRRPGRMSGARVVRCSFWGEEKELCMFAVTAQFTAVHFSLFSASNFGSRQAGAS